MSQMRPATIEIQCDVCGHWESAPTATQMRHARQEMREAGWRVVRNETPGGPLRDLCSDCAAEIMDVK